MPQDQTEYTAEPDQTAHAARLLRGYFGDDALLEASRRTVRAMEEASEGEQAHWWDVVDFLDSPLAPGKVVIMG